MENLTKNNKRITTCENCGNKNAIITTASIKYMACFIFSLFIMAFSILIPFIGIILAPVMLLTSLVCLIISLVASTSKKCTVVCNECNSRYDTTKDNLKQVK